MSVYPNPCVNTLFVRNISQAPLNLMIYDASGKLLNALTSSITTVALNMSAYPSGVYFIRIQNKLNDKSTTRKVVKIQ